MPLAAWLLLAATSLPASAEPLTVAVSRQRDALELRVHLVAELPDPLVSALPTGAQVRVVYPIRFRAQRRLMWDRRLWRGEVAATVTFDPVVGRYRCELVLDRVIVAAEETQSHDQALAWLRSPPAVRLELPPGRRAGDLVVRVRAVFSATTRWLLFPVDVATDWVEVTVAEGAP